MEEKYVDFTLSLKGIPLKFHPIACRAQALSIIIDNEPGRTFYDRIRNRGSYHPIYNPRRDVGICKFPLEMFNDPMSDHNHRERDIFKLYTTPFKLSIDLLKTTFLAIWIQVTKDRTVFEEAYDAYKSYSTFCTSNRVATQIVYSFIEFKVLFEDIKFFRLESTMVLNREGF